MKTKEEILMHHTGHAHGLMDAGVYRAMDEYADQFKHAANSILDNTLFMDNASEALYEVIGEGTNKYSMLICEAMAGDIKVQLHIVAVADEFEFVENDEEMPVFKIDEDYRLKNIE